MFGKKVGEFKSIRAKRGMFEIKSRWTNVGESFDLFVNGNQVANFQDTGVKELMTVLAILSDEWEKRKKKEGV